MQEEINRPIFVVGSPRSGTSILAWCLGHHPNIFPVPESNWIGDFAVNVAVAHQIGSARGRLSILSAMEIPDDEFFAAFGRPLTSWSWGIAEISKSIVKTAIARQRLTYDGSKPQAWPPGRRLGGSMERLSILCTSAACESFFLKVGSCMCFAMLMR